MNPTIWRIYYLGRNILVRFSEKWKIELVDYCLLVMISAQCRQWRIYSIVGHCDHGLDDIIYPSSRFRNIFDFRLNAQENILINAHRNNPLVIPWGWYPIEKWLPLSQDFGLNLFLVFSLWRGNSQFCCGKAKKFTDTSLHNA